MDKQLKSLKTFQPKKTKQMNKLNQNLNSQILQKTDLVISLLKKQYEENRLYSQIQQQILLNSSNNKQISNSNYQLSNSNLSQIYRSGNIYSKTLNLIHQSSENHLTESILIPIPKNKKQRTRINSVSDMTFVQNQIDYNYTRLLSCKQIKANKNYSILLQPFMQQYYVFDMKQYVFPLKINFFRVMTAQVCILYIGFDKQYPGQNLPYENSLIKSNYPKQHDLKINIEKNFSFQINKKGNKVVDKIYFMFTTKKNTFQATFKILSGLQQKQINKNHNFLSPQVCEQLKRKDKFLLSITSHSFYQKAKNSRTQMAKTLSSDFINKKFSKNYSAPKSINKTHFQNKQLDRPKNIFYQNNLGKTPENISQIQNKTLKLFSLTSFSYSKNKNMKKSNVKKNAIKTQNSDSLQKALKMKMNAQTDTYYNQKDNKSPIKIQQVNYCNQNVTSKISPVKDKKQKIQLWIQKNNQLKILVKFFKEAINQYHNQAQELKLRSKKVTKNITICIFLIKFIKNSYIQYQKKKKYLENVFKINYFLSTFLRNLKKKYTQSKIMIRDKNYRIPYGILPISQLLSKTLHKNSVSNAEKVISTTFQKLYYSLSSMQILSKSDILVNKIKKVQLRYKQTHKARIKMLMIFSKNHIAKMTTSHSHFRMFQKKLFDSKDKILQKICLQYLKDEILKFNQTYSTYKKKINQIQNFKLINFKIQQEISLNNSKNSPLKFKASIKNQSFSKSLQKFNKKQINLWTLPKQIKQKRRIKNSKQPSTLLQIPRNPVKPQKRIFRNLDTLRSMIRGWFQIQYKKWQKKKF